MTLSAEQIEKVREIIDIPSYDVTGSLLSVLNSVQETATINDVTQWNKIANKFSYIAGGKLAYNNKKDDLRLTIRNRVRRRLGLPLISEEELTGNVHTIEYSNPNEPNRGGGSCCE